MDRRCRLVATRVASSAALLLMLLGTGGCHEGVAWHDYDYPRVLEDARADKKLVFVYFRDFASVDCTKFEDDVLMLPQARAALELLYAVPLQWNTLVDAPLAERWQIHKVPAYVILDPSETVLARRLHPITLDQLIQDISRSQATFRGRAAPSKPKSSAVPPPPPPAAEPSQP